MTESTNRPVAYTDGSCIGNPGPGGWAVHVEYPDGRVVELGGGDLRTTNNRMELRAAIEAVRATLDWPAVTIITDSQYVRRGVTEWVAGWKRKGWITSTGTPVVNQDLWTELDAISDARVTWEWTRGHSGDPGNERCDAIARWFSETIEPLAGPKKARGNVAARRAAPASVLGGGTAGRTAGPASSKPPAGTYYVSVVDGIPARHEIWADCQQRVTGVKGARYKKVRGLAEEEAVMKGWGLTPEDLYGL
jgi:ribonuclease HI